MDITVYLFGSGDLPVPPTRGGAVEKYEYFLSKGLSKHNVNTHLFTPLVGNRILSEENHRPSIHQLKIVRSPFARGFLSDIQFGFGVAKEISRLHDKSSTEVIHCNVNTSSTAVFLRSSLKDIPVVYGVHNPLPRRYLSDLLYRSFVYRLRFAAEKFALTRADRIIAITRAIKQDILRIVRIPGEKIDVIPYGIDAERYSPKPSNRTNTIGMSHRELPYFDDPFALYVGRISSDKGIEILIRAASRVTQQFPDVKFVLVGPLGSFGSKDSNEKGTNYFHMLLKERKKRGLEKSVFFLGPVYREELLIELYRKATLFVLPSLTEAFGLVLLEAMAVGLPVVATRVGGIPEVVADGRSGILVELGNAEQLAEAIIRVLSNKKYSQKLGNSGRRIVIQNFSWESVTEMTIQTYWKAVETKQ